MIIPTYNQMILIICSSMLLFDFITKCFYALLSLIKKIWLTFLKVLRACCVENYNIFAKCCENSNQSNTARVGVLNEGDAHISLPENSAQLTFNTPEVNASFNVRAECLQHKNQSNAPEELLSSNGEYDNLSARSVQFISTSQEINVSSNVRAEYSQVRNQSNTFEGSLSNNGAFVKLPARSVQFIRGTSEANVSSNVRAECTQNRNQSNSFETGLLVNNDACVNLPVRSTQLFNNLQELNENLTGNDFGTVSGESNKRTLADFTKTDGNLRNFESRASLFAVGTSQAEEVSEVKQISVSGSKHCKSGRPFNKEITNAARSSSSNQGHEDIPLILIHRKRKFCGPFK